MKPRTDTELTFHEEAIRAKPEGFVPEYTTLNYLLSLSKQNSGERTYILQLNHFVSHCYQAEVEVSQGLRTRGNQFYGLSSVLDISGECRHFHSVITFDTKYD